MPRKPGSPDQSKRFGFGVAEGPSNEVMDFSSDGGPVRWLAFEATCWNSAGQTTSDECHKSLVTGKTTPWQPGKFHGGDNVPAEVFKQKPP